MTSMYYLGYLYPICIKKSFKNCFIILIMDQIMIKFEKNDFLFFSKIDKKMNRVLFISRSSIKVHKLYLFGKLRTYRIQWNWFQPAKFIRRSTVKLQSWNSWFLAAILDWKNCKVSIQMRLNLKNYKRYQHSVNCYE